MKEFYSIEENFNFLYNNIYVLLSDGILESSVAENWLANWYVCDKYNTTRAVEKYAANILIPRLKNSQIYPDYIETIINTKLNGCYESYNSNYDLDDKKYLLNNIQFIDITESTVSYIIQDFESDDVLSYIKESYNDEEFDTSNDYILNEDSKEILNIISQIKNMVLESKDNLEELKRIKDKNTMILYKHKYVKLESLVINKNDIYFTLESLLSNQSDKMINYSLSELNHVNNLIEHLSVRLDKTSDEFVYRKAIEKFESMIESIFFEDTEIEVDEIVELCKITEALCDYEATIEASSRIITKGTEKLTKAAGKASAKSRGLSASDSKVGQIKRGAKIVDDRASDAINNKIDQIINFTQDQKREKIITGKNTIRLSKVLKTIIGLIIAGKVVKTSPLIGAAVTIVGLIGARALSKNTELREKRRIMLDLETELKITREKIEDAKGDNAKEQKYELMRIEAQLEKEIFRIKHGLKYY
jgi:hypothetical protein